MRQLTSPHCEELEIKKSRFICHCAPISSVEDAMAFVEAVSLSDATHNCWAYKMGNSYRFFDDGEPGGTAGKPMLSAIERSQIDNVVAVVVRYFGGTKLGAGGLVRAYASAVGNCLHHSPVEQVQPTEQIRVRIPFAAIGSVHQLLAKSEVEKLDEKYGSSGVDFALSIPTDGVTDFVTAITNATAGDACVLSPDDSPEGNDA